MATSRTTTQEAPAIAPRLAALAIIHITPQRGSERLADTAARIVDRIARAGHDLLDAHGELVVLPIGSYGPCSFGLMDAVLTVLEHRIAAGRGRQPAA